MLDNHAQPDRTGTRNGTRCLSLVPSGVAAGGECLSDSCLAEADADGVLAAQRIGEFNEYVVLEAWVYVVLEAWVAGSIGTFVGSPTNELPSVNPSFRPRGSK